MRVFIQYSLTGGLPDSIYSERNDMHWTRVSRNSLYALRSVTGYSVPREFPANLNFKV